MNPWDEAKRMHEEAGLDWLKTLDYYMHVGYVFSGPDFLVFAEELHGAWAVAFGYGPGSAKNFIQAMPYWLPKIAWRRANHVSHGMKFIDTERMCRFFHIDPEPLKLRTR